MASPLRTWFKALAVSPGVIEAANNRQLNFYQRLGGVNQQVMASWQAAQSAAYGWQYTNQPTVRKVIDYIARNFAQLDLYLYERISATEREQRGDLPAALTMRYPNELEPADHFIFGFVADWLLHNNAYALIFQGPGQSVLIRVPAWAMRIEGSARYTIEGFRVARSDGSMWPDLSRPPIPPENVLHWKGYDPMDPRFGVSPLEALRDTLAEDKASQQANVELLKSGLSLPGYMKRPLEAPVWSEEARHRFQEDWTNMMKDATRHIPVAEEGMEFDDFGMTPKDAQMHDGRRFTTEEVCDVYGVPTGLFGDGGGTAEDRKRFNSDCLVPLTRQLSRLLDFGILRGVYNKTDFYYEFDLTSLNRGDVKERYAAITASVGGPWITRNEARAAEGYPAVEGGDEVITPMNVITGNNPKPAPNVMGPQDPNEPPQDGSYRERKLKQHLLPRRRSIEARRNASASAHEELLRKHFEGQFEATGAKANGDLNLASGLLALSKRQVSAEGQVVSLRMASDFDMGRVQNYLSAKASSEAVAINAQTRADIETMGAEAAYERAIGQRAAAAGMGIATGLQAWATKEAIQQAGTTHQITVSGGECEVCAEFQGTWGFNELPSWPPYHPSCECITDVS